MTNNAAKPCGCGSCEDAFNTALKMYAQSVKNKDCDLWRTRLFFTLHLMSSLERGYVDFQDNNIDPHLAMMSNTDFEQIANRDSNLAAKCLAVHSVSRGVEEALCKVMLDLSGDSSVRRERIVGAFQGNYVAEEVKPT